MARQLTNTRAWKISTGPIGFVLALAWLVWLATTSVWPVSWWLDVRDVYVYDAVEGETP